MPKNFKIATLLALALATTSAFAAQFYMTGSQLSGDTFVLQNNIQNFSADIWFDPQGKTYPQSYGYSIYLGIATTSNTNGRLANSSPIETVGYTGNYASIFNPNAVAVQNRLVGSSITRSGVFVGSLGLGLPGTNNPLRNKKPFGIYWSAITSPTATIALPFVPVRIATVNMRANNLQGVFGDTNDESGIIIYRDRAAGSSNNPQKSSGIGGKIGSRGVYGSIKYSVRVGGI